MTIAPNWAAKRDDFLLQNSGTYWIKGLRFRDFPQPSDHHRLLRDLYAGHGVSINGGTPKSSILMGLPLINHPFGGITINGNPHMLWQCSLLPDFFRCEARAACDKLWISWMASKQNCRSRRACGCPISLPQIVGNPSKSHIKIH